MTKKEILSGLKKKHLLRLADNFSIRSVNSKMNKDQIVEKLSKNPKITKEELDWGL